MTTQSPQEVAHPERECISCGERGHWYLHCKKVSFWGAVAEAFGVTLIGSEPPPTPTTTHAAEPQKEN